MLKVRYYSYTLPLPVILKHNGNMRKIKLLTFLTLMLGSITQAQEKQNDATWEETVDFIKNNMEVFKKNGNRYSREAVISDKEIIYKEIYAEDKFTYILKLEDFNKLTAGKLKFEGGSESNNPVFYLQTEGDLVRWEWDSSTGENDLGYQNFLSIKIYLGIDNPKFKRLVKAFKHLAYLANEKRKESKF